MLAVAYLLLAIRQRSSCWVAAFISSCLYVWVLFGARLYMESVLNAFYAAMAVYGFWQWQQGRGGGALAVCRWPTRAPRAGRARASSCLSLVSSYFLRRFTPAALPFVDSMVTWSSVFATFLVARKVYENWHWWLVIDSVSLCLYFTRHLYLTMLLFGLYLVLIVIGMRQWRRSLPAAAICSGLKSRRLAAQLVPGAGTIEIDSLGAGLLSETYRVFARWRRLRPAAWRREHPPDLGRGSALGSAGARARSRAGMAPRLVYLRSASAGFCSRAGSTGASWVSRDVLRFRQTWREWPRSCAGFMPCAMPVPARS